MVSYEIQPQVAGELGDDTQVDSGQRPAVVTAVHYVLDLPEADDLITSHPVFLVARALGETVGEEKLSGFALAPAQVSISDDWLDEGQAAPEPPPYAWLQPGTDPSADLWLDDTGSLHGSQRARDVLERFSVERCAFFPDPSRQE